MSLGTVGRTRDALFSDCLFFCYLSSSPLVSFFLLTCLLFSSLLLSSLSVASPDALLSSFLRFVSRVCSINGLFDLLRWLIWPCLIVLFLMCDSPCLFLLKIIKKKKTSYEKTPRPPYNGSPSFAGPALPLSPPAVRPKEAASETTWTVRTDLTSKALFPLNRRF